MFSVAILAGGLATRLRPITQKIPKALIEVNGEPFIAHQFRLLCRHGISHVVVCTGFLGEMIQEFAGDGASFGLKVEYSADGPTLLGTGGALKRALPLLGEAFFVLYGDSYLTCDYHAVQSAFETSKKMALMTVFKNEGKWEKSNVEFEDGRLLEYDKKNQTPAMRHVDYGLGVFSKLAFDSVCVANDKPCDLAHLYQDILNRGQLAGFEVPHRFYEIGSFEGLKEVRQYIASHATNEENKIR